MKKRTKTPYPLDRKQIAFFVKECDFMFFIGHLQRRTGVDIPLHTHDFTELTVILSGTAWHIIDNDRYPISAGEVFVTHGNMSHGYRNPVGLDLMDIMFKPEMLKPYSDSFKRLPGYKAMFVRKARFSRNYGLDGHLKLDAKNMLEVKERLTRMKREYTDMLPGYRAVLISELVALIVYLSRLYAQTNASSNLTLSRMESTIDYLEQSYAERISLSKLACHAGMSVRQFTRKFRQSTGAAPMEYLLHLRTTRARELLVNGKTNITETAFAVGFKDSNYFARQFRKMTGLSPREYQKYYERD